MTGEGHWTYVDVAANRIQHYISRTPRLKGQRGASAWLSWATDGTQIRTVLRKHINGNNAELNPEAGEADGRVSIRFRADGDPGPLAEATARAVATHLRYVLPAIELSGVWGTGRTYVETYREKLKSQGANPPFVSLPPRNEFPPLASCAECRAAPAATAIDIYEDKDVQVCLDCLARYEGRYRKRALAAESRQARDAGDSAVLPIYREEAVLARGLGLDPVKGTVQHFDELAALGSADTNRNHVATVYVDGNAIGAFFDRVAAHGAPDLKARISAAISKATRDSLLAAAKEILDEGPRQRVPVIPHIIGGDDMVVSVVADRAWRFVTTYLNEFASRIRAIHGVPPDLYEPAPPTASAGVVFAHASFPFRRAVELAGSRLRDAKRQLCGTTPAVAWLDVTRDGERSPAWQQAWTVDDLSALADPLQDLRTQIEPSGRATLSRLVDTTRPGVSAARLREYGRRLDKEAALAPFLAAGGSAERVTRLAGALSLVRWWR